MGLALKLLYPSQCVTCGDLVEADHGLCAGCWRDTPFVDGARCDCCGAPLMGGEPEERAICDACLIEPRPWARGRTALVYRDAARRMVLSLKAGGREDLAETAAAWMARAGEEILTPGALLVPVPLHWIRFLQRRFNQAALLAATLGAQTGLEVLPDALKRVMRTRKLDRLSPVERFQALDGAIIPNAARDLGGRHVILIDDVMTSGATLAACTAAAQSAGAARVDVLTLARTMREA